MKKKIIKIFLILFFIVILALIYSYIFKKDKIVEKSNIDSIEESAPYNSNIIKNVNYASKDAKGNEYIIASEGEIDYSNNNVIYLTKVRALIKLSDNNNIKITSDYGRYNSNNFDTVFSKNVIVNYLDNKITGEYLDFSINRNSMFISRNVIYTNLENILKGDVVEIDIETKDTKISMYESNKKVNIKSKN